MGANYGPQNMGPYLFPGSWLGSGYVLYALKAARSTPKQAKGAGLEF